MVYINVSGYGRVEMCKNAVTLKVTTFTKG